jgi:hypothetical protein
VNRYITDVLEKNNMTCVSKRRVAKTGVQRVEPESGFKSLRKFEFHVLGLPSVNTIVVVMMSDGARLR